tara:strand:- start:1296 stop:1433 length:138 start_codon:yes stop_codon:yes gene_type:complete
MELRYRREGEVYDEMTRAEMEVAYIKKYSEEQQKHSCQSAAHAYM